MKLPASSFFFSLLLVVLATALVVIPRLVELNVVFNYFTFEVANEYIVARDIVVNHSFPLIGTYAGGVATGLNRGPLFNYFLTLPFILGQGDPYATKLAMLLLSFCGIFLSWYFTNKIFGKRAAIFATIFLAASPAMIEFSVRPWSPNPIPYIISPLLFFLYKIIQKQYAYTWFVGLFLGLLMSFETAVAGRLVFIFLVMAILYLFKNRFFFKYICYGVIAFLVTQLPVFIYDLYHSFINTRGIFTLLFNNHAISSQAYGLPLTQRVGNIIETFAWCFRTIFSPNILLSLLFFMGLIAGIYLYNKSEEKQERKHLVMLMAILPIASLATFLFYGGQIFNWWIIDLIPIICILEGVLFSNFYERKTGKIFSIFLISLLLFSLTKNTFYKYRNMQIAPALQIPILKPIDTVFKDAKKDFNTVLYSNNWNTNDYNYLFWWKGHSIYHFYPSFKKGKEYYVLLERNYDKATETKLLTVGPNEILLFNSQIENRFIIKKIRNTTFPY